MDAAGDAHEHVLRTLDVLAVDAKQIAVLKSLGEGKEEGREQSELN